MLGLVRLPVSLGSARYQAAKERITERLAGRRYLGPFLLGVLFALSFCPFSAVLYFGMLIPLALREQSPVVLPSVFAIATGLPVVVLSLLLVQGIATAGRAVQQVQTVEVWLRRAVGGVFIIAGIYLIAVIWFG